MNRMAIKEFAAMTACYAIVALIACMVLAPEQVRAALLAVLT